MNALAAIHGAADPQAARSAVARMLDRMPERGAGHRTVIAGERGVIGAAGRSPAFGSKAGVAIAAGDVRLDNAAELRHALNLPSDTADAVILVEAFEKWGDGFAAHLAGDFAFALIDRRARRLIAVRDPLGVRPLYYRRGTSTVFCASELRALVEPGDAIDEGFLAEVLTGDIVDQASTPYASVCRLPAAHMLVADGDRVSVTRYWEPPREPHRGSLEEHAERFREVFDEAVRARCAGLSTVGAHLSGGLDSSSVLASICANGFAAPVAGSMRFPWPEADEGPWIDAVSAKWGVTPVSVTPATNPPAHDLASAAVHFDIPTFPTDGPIFRQLHPRMNEAGASVILTGSGGDQWWNGEMAYLADLLGRGRIGALRAWRQSGATIGEESAWDWTSFARFGVYPLVPRVLRRAWRVMRPVPAPSWISPAFAARVDLTDRLRRRPETPGAPNESWRRMRWRLDSGEEAFSKERADRFALESGVELRHPFYDKRLVELAFTTPQDAKIHGGQNRASMREAMRSRLPAQVASRTTKADLGPLLVGAASAPDIAPYLSMTSLAERGWIVPAAAAELAARVVRDGDAASTRYLWRLLGAEAWLRDAFGPQ